MSVAANMFNLIVDIISSSLFQQENYYLIIVTNKTKYWVFNSITK